MSWVCVRAREMKWQNEDCELTVQLLDPHGNAYPEVTHADKTYVIGSPGGSFKIHCCPTACRNSLHTDEPVVVKVHIDGKPLSTYYTSYHSQPVKFKGWRTAADHSDYQQFIFASPKAAGFGEASDTHAGVIKITCCVETGQFLRPVTGYVDTPASMTSVEKPNGKKFFQATSLVTAAGDKIINPPKRQSHSSICGRSLGSYVLHLETAEVLLLRGVLSRTNPQHAKLLPAALQEGNVVAAAPVNRVKVDTPARRRVHGDDNRVYDLTGDSDEDDEIQVWTVAKRVKTEQAVEIVDK
eukprot:jgi/Chlat1/3633/Chrsp237S08818